MYADSQLGPIRITKYPLLYYYYYMSPAVITLMGTALDG